MSKETSVTGHSESPIEGLPTAFAALRSEIEGVLAEIQTLGPEVTDKIQRALTEPVLALEDEIKQVMEAAQDAQKEAIGRLRNKYLKELELAITEKDLMDRRFATAIQQAEQQKEAEAAELAKARSDIASLQTDLQQTLLELIDMDENLRRARDKSAEAEQAVARVEGEARQIAAEKQDVEQRLQQAEASRAELYSAYKQLQAELNGFNSERRSLNSELQESELKRSKTAETLEEMVSRNHELSAEKIEMEEKLLQSGFGFVLRTFGKAQLRLMVTALRQNPLFAGLKFRN